MYRESALNYTSVRVFGNGPFISQRFECYIYNYFQTIYQIVVSCQNRLHMCTTDNQRDTA